MCPKFVSKHNSDNQGGVRPKNSADGFMGVQVQPHILPVKSLWLGLGCNKVKLNCLFDTASQRSYVNSDTIKSLNYDADALPEVSLDINTMAGVVSHTYKQISLDNEYHDIPIPILIDDELKIEFKVPQMQDV